MHLAYVLILCTLLVLHARRNRSLSKDGAATAVMVGLATFSAPSAFFSTVLLAFFFSSSKLTKYKAARKKALEEEYHEGGQRNWAQVACNGALGSLIALIYSLSVKNASCLEDGWHTWEGRLVLIYIGHYACCCGDTWASEVGVLNKSWPRLITTFKRVPPGTNGGISQLGLIASAAGGLTIGTTAAVTLALSGCKFPWRLLVVGTVAGLVGSLVDSLLGATVQSSLYDEKKGMIVNPAHKRNAKVISGKDILNNNQVNFLSSLITSILCGALG